jgi:hypothetical protein
MSQLKHRAEALVLTVLKKTLIIVASVCQFAALGCAHTTDPAPTPEAGRLAGSWAVHFHLDSLVLGGASVKNHDAHGRISFRPEFTPKDADPPAPGKLSPEEQERIKRLEWGEFDIDFSPYWPNGPIAPVPSTTLLGSPEDPLKEALGLVISEDTVGVILNPHFTHGGLALAGRFLSDSVVVGKWGIRGDTTRSGGTFEMQREPKH